jgi:pyruvate dehydrogenase E2 component (dihydrolipoamide acetyltransferase)
MAIEVKLPNIGDGIDAGDVLEIFVAVGDTVKKDQGLVELETDKATVTVPSPASGKITKILVSPGQSVPIGAVIVEMDSSDSPAVTPPKAAPVAEAAKPAEPAQPVETAQVEPAKAAEPTKAVQPPAAKPQPAPSVAPAPVPTPVQAAMPAANTADDLVAASPAVRRFAREVGVDLVGVQGTGEGGRVTRDDVLRSVRESSSRANSSPVAAEPRAAAPTTSLVSAAVPVASPVGGNKAVALPGTPGSDDYGPVRVEKLTKIRKTIANQMHKSWMTVPRVTNFDDADVTDLEAFRLSSKDDYAAQGIKLTTMPFLMKAVAIALRNNPVINAQIDLESEQLIYRDYVNLGVAVDTDRGLVVPNVRNAHLLSIPDIAKALADMAARVRTGDFGINELRGGTFTISNLGAIGGTYSTPIVNIPEVAILLVGRTRKLPVVMDDDSIQVRQMMPLSLSYDHRLVDGGTAARFLNDVIALLEAPSRLLLAIS